MANQLTPELTPDSEVAVQVSVPEWFASCRPPGSKSRVVDTCAFLNTYQPRRPAPEGCFVWLILLEGFYAESPLFCARIVVRGVYGVCILDAHLKLHGIAFRYIGQRGRGEAEVGERDEDGDIAVSIDALAVGRCEVQWKIPETEVEFGSKADWRRGAGYWLGFCRLGFLLVVE